MQSPGCHVVDRRKAICGGQLDISHFAEGQSPGLSRNSQPLAFIRVEEALLMENLRLPIFDNSYPFCCQHSHGDHQLYSVDENVALLLQWLIAFDVLIVTRLL
jgi:hypothetical protein